MIEEEWLPNALAIGVQYSDFWKLNPRRLRHFNKAYQLKKEEEFEIINFQTWLQGIYFGQVLSASFSKNEKYFEEPIKFNKNKEDLIEDSKKEAEKFNAIAHMFNSSFDKKEG